MPTTAHRQDALDTFVTLRKKRKDVIGIIVCGSYITGSPTKQSDIDVHILLSKKTSWRERGNIIIDGVLIEYFANPVAQHYVYATEDYAQRQRHNAHMFITGKLLFDKTGEVKQLIKDMKKMMTKKYAPQTATAIELAKYHLRDMADNLAELDAVKAADFTFVLHNNLSTLLDTYGAFLQFDALPIHKIRRLLVEKSDKKKYHIRDFPDKAFVTLFIKTITTTDKPKKMLQSYERLTHHVLEKMWGFSIDGWSLKSPLA